MGLATVWAIIERHGGMIEFKSKEGLGTTFSIYLPATAERPTAAKASTVKAGIEGGDETILVAEDDAMVCNLTVKILERAGYQVIVARDGAEAIDLFERFTEEIALAILDVVMPRKGGREVYESIKARRPDVPVLFHSGYSYEAIGRDHLPEGEYHLIQKPYQPQDLLQRVHHLIRARV